MERIPGGTFTMGSEDGSIPSALPTHQVKLTGFYMSKFPVTQEQWLKAMGASIENQPLFSDCGIGNHHPMYYVNWYEAIEFCNKLSMMEGLKPVYTLNGTTNPEDWGPSGSAWNAIEANWSADGYRLPTEAEWEYACRAGTTTAWNTGTNITPDQANFSPSLGATRVGNFGGNRWGLYDMHGNVWEWCWDRYGAYLPDPQTNPTGDSAGAGRVFRGGSWGNVAQDLRSAYRNFNDPGNRVYSIGFRVVRRP